MEISPTIRYLGVVEHFIYTPFWHFVIIGFWDTVFVVQSKRMGPLMATNMMTPGCTMMVWYRMPMVWTKNHDQYSRKGSWMTDLVWYPYAPCMECTEYLPTFAQQITQMLIDIPYMEHMGYGFTKRWGCPDIPIIIQKKSRHGVTPWWAYSLSGHVPERHPQIYDYTLRYSNVEQENAPFIVDCPFTISIHISIYRKLLINKSKTETSIMLDVFRAVLTKPLQKPAPALWFVYLCWGHQELNSGLTEACSSHGWIDCCAGDHRNRFLDHQVVFGWGTGCLFGVMWN